MVWCDGKCMSTKNNTNNRCKCRALSKQDFCRNHIKTHQYNIELLKSKKHDMVDVFINELQNKIDQRTTALNEKYIHCLLGIRNDWNEVPCQYRIFIGDSWWDIRNLMRMFAHSLNQSEYSNPYPKCPEDPFTRKRFSAKEIKACYDRVSMLNAEKQCIEVNDAVLVLMRMHQRTLSSIINKKDDHEIVQLLCNEFLQSLRYKIINDQNSQGIRGGYWVPKKQKLSTFEQKYQEYLANFRHTQYNNRMPRSFQNIINYIQNAEIEEYPF